MTGNYGTHAFDNNAIVIGSRCAVLKNRGGEMYARLYQFDVEGYISGTSQATITTAMNAVDTALARPFQDFIFYHDDSTESHFSLDNNSSISGVTVTDGPNWVKEPRGANFVTMMKFTFTVSAEYPLGNTQNLLLEFNESVTFEGGGPRFAVRDCLNAAPMKQQMRVATVYRAVQQGMSVGYRKYPNPPPPLWPAALLEAPKLEKKSPTLKGRDYEGFGITWSYSFASPGPLGYVDPNFWP